MKKEEDPERILMNLNSMPSGSFLIFLTFSSFLQRESEEEAEAAGWQGLRDGRAAVAVGRAAGWLLVQRAAGWCGPASCSFLRY